MVAAVRAGESLRSVARQHRVGLRTVQRWVSRADGRALDEVDWRDRSHAPRRTHRSSQVLEETVVALRSELKDTSPLGEYGAAAIHDALLVSDFPVVPSVRTIGRILERRGALDGKRRVRRPAPPKGWYLPQGTIREIDSFDIVEGLRIKGGPQVEVLNGVSVHGGLVAAWPVRAAVSARLAVMALVEHWQRVGLPTYAQFDNDTIFQGPHQHPDALGRVTRLCLSLGVIPVFVPVRESGFQAAIESFNGRWQAKVWARFTHESLEALQERSAAHVAASRRRLAVRIDHAPDRRPFPCDWQLNLQAHPRGRIIWLRRTTEHGSISMLGRSFPVDPRWTHRLVRAELDLDAGSIRFHALRRRDPSAQPLLNVVSYQLPIRPFRD